MKRIGISFVLILYTWTVFILPVTAKNTQEEFLNESLEQVEAELMEQLPEETKEFLSELQLDELNFQQILALEPGQFLEFTYSQLRESWQEPVRVLGKMIGILLLSAMLFPLKHSVLKGETAHIYSLAASICLCTILMEPLIETIVNCMSSLETSSNFLLALIPILTAILAVGGQTATASVYQLLLFTACQLVAQLASGIAASLLGIYSAFGILTAIFPQFALQGLVDGIKKLICWGVGIVTTLFVALLSLQTFVTVNVDVVTLKASRFLMGSFIPVVGTILSEAFGAAKACFSLLRSTVGTFGIVAAFCMLLPVLLKIAVWCVVTWLGTQLSTILQVKELGDLLKNVSNSFSILLALQFSMLLFSIVAVALVVFIGTGG